MSSDLTNLNPNSNLKPSANATTHIGRYVDLSLNSLKIIQEEHPTLQVTRAHAAELEAAAFAQILGAHFRGLTTQALEFITPHTVASAIEGPLLNGVGSIESSIIELKNQAEFSELYGEVSTMRHYNYTLEKPIRIVMDEQLTYRERLKKSDSDERFLELNNPVRRAMNPRNPNGKTLKRLEFAKRPVENARYLSEKPVAREMGSQLFLT